MPIYYIMLFIEIPTQYMYIPHETLLQYNMQCFMTYVHKKPNCILLLQINELMCDITITFYNYLTINILK